MQERLATRTDMGKKLNRFHFLSQLWLSGSGYLEWDGVKDGKTPSELNRKNSWLIRDARLGPGLKHMPALYLLGTEMMLTGNERSWTCICPQYTGCKISYSSTKHLGCICGCCTPSLLILSQHPLLSERPTVCELLQGRAQNSSELQHLKLFFKDILVQIT